MTDKKLEDKLTDSGFFDNDLLTLHPSMKVVDSVNGIPLGKSSSSFNGLKICSSPNDIPTDKTLAELNYQTNHNPSTFSRYWSKIRNYI